MRDGVDNPLVSVIVPSFNHGRFLRRCLDSILEQDYRPIEVLVMDGASTDETLDVLKAYSQIAEVRWISEPDKGIVDAVNKGLALVRGAIASIQSADDYYLPGAFRQVVEEFKRHPEAGLVYGDSLSVSVDEQPRNSWLRPPHSNALCLALCVCIPQSSAFFNLQLARTVGGWRDRYYTADWDFWIRLMFQAPSRKLDALLSAWRTHPDQRTEARRRVFEHFRRMVDDASEIRDGGFRVRQAARAGKQLIGISFDRRGPWTRLAYLLKAGLLYPPLWWHVPGKRWMIPGAVRFWGPRPPPKYPGPIS